jgi:ATP-dependent Clp protease ATP-binding subunit ClpC
MMFERLTDSVRRVLVLAHEEARLLNHKFIGTGHILLGLLREGDGVAAQALGALAVLLEDARERVRDHIGSEGGATTASPPITSRARAVLALSLREALLLGHDYIGTEHVLLGLVREGEGVGARAW